MSPLLAVVCGKNSIYNLILLICVTLLGLSLMDLWSFGLSFLLFHYCFHPLQESQAQERILA